MSTPEKSATAPDPLVESTVVALKTRRWDLAGVVLSGACAIHCAATSVLLVLLPAAGSFASHETHQVLAVLAGTVATVVFVPSLRQGKWSLPALAALGAGLVIAAAFASLPPRMEIGITVVGGLILVISHLTHARRHSSYHHSH
ncbi:MAG: MerC domain-containing protein [Polyangiaceae bacterium]